jgi:hypothetical protein
MAYSQLRCRDALVRHAGVHIRTIRDEYLSLVHLGQLLSSDRALVRNATSFCLVLVWWPQSR